MKFQGLYFNPLKTYDANLKYATNHNIKKKKKKKKKKQFENRCILHFQL